MSLFLGIAVILIFLLIIGVNRLFVAAAVLGILSLITVAIHLFFIYSLIQLCLSKKSTAIFSRAGKSKRGFDCAFYRADECEYPNAFPKEIAFANRIYRTDKEITVRINRKSGLVFDKNARICTVIGFIFFSAFTPIIIYLLVQVIGLLL